MNIYYACRYIIKKLYPIYVNKAGNGPEIRAISKEFKSISNEFKLNNIFK